MPTWGKLLYELQKELAKQQADVKRTGKPPEPGNPGPLDLLRQKYLGRLAEHTGRPVIAYASGWLEGRQMPDPSALQVATRDVAGFMEAIYGLEAGPLDLILHSPGGDPNAAEQIMRYLRDYGFGPIRAIVPMVAMSAATMMALCCDEILMGRHSQLGPIDPQFTILTAEGPRQGPAQAILDQFEMAKAEIAAAPASVGAWMPILRSYMPALLTQCRTAQTAGVEFVSQALQRYMLADMDAAEAARTSKEIAEWFSDHKTHASHGRPLRYEDIAAKRVKVTLLEEDDGLQEAVLSAWHAIQLTLSQFAVGKLITNHHGTTWLIQASPTLQLAIAPQEGVQPANPAPVPGAPRRSQPRDRR